MTDSLIHLRVPAAVKGRWVRASRSAGMKLTDYIVDAVDAYMQQQMTRITIPNDVKFTDLKLQRDAVQDDLNAEAITEDAAGQHYSHEPGRA